MKRLSALLTLAVAVFVLPVSVYASNDDNIQASVEVDHIARGFEKVQEKIKLALKFSSESKLRYKLELTEKRLAELRYSVENDKINLVEETASRYSTYLGRAYEYGQKKNLLEKNKGEFLGVFKRHYDVINELQKKYEYDSAWWLVTQHDLNILKQYSNSLGGTEI